MPWLGLGATLAWNYARHRQGKSTICGLTRRLLTPQEFVLGFGLFVYTMVRHILDGYD
jgi:hypothetical protein